MIEENETLKNLLRTASASPQDNESSKGASGDESKSVARQSTAIASAMEEQLAELVEERNNLSEKLNEANADILKLEQSMRDLKESHNEHIEQLKSELNIDGTAA